VLVVSRKKQLLTSDYVGISVLIAASILTVEYHGFYCQPAAQISYMTATTVLGIVGMCIPWLEWFDRQYLSCSSASSLIVVKIITSKLPFS
jgi:predicted membrane channel-forming protein YqfA (hemolysin III family)